jgi:flagellar biosynthetic protein FliR
MLDPLNWLLVFLRAIALLTIFPVFSGPNFPVQIRLALAALVAFLVAPLVPTPALARLDFWSAAGWMALEIGFGLLLGFVSRMVFYALEIGGGLIATEIGLMLPAGINPMSQANSSEMSTVLHYIAGMLFLTLNLHHSLLAAFQRSFIFLPSGGGHLPQSLLLDVIGRTSHLFWFALQVTAPVMAVTFLVSIVFALLSRAVPQMNVFAENFSVRLLTGLTVVGLTCSLMAQHIANFLHRLPQDVLRIAQLLGAR